MNRHLQDISEALPKGAHAVVVLDGAGWRRSKDPVVPDDVTLMRLPPYSPEPDSMEQVFQYIKSNFLCNRLFETEHDVEDALVDSWDRSSTDPDLIRSITTREWAVVTA